MLWYVKNIYVVSFMGWQTGGGNLYDIVSRLMGESMGASGGCQVWWEKLDDDKKEGSNDFLFI